VATEQTGHSIEFWGRYFKDPGNASPEQYQPNKEAALLNQKNIRVLPPGGAILPPSAVQGPIAVTQPSLGHSDGDERVRDAEPVSTPDAQRPSANATPKRDARILGSLFSAAALRPLSGAYPQSKTRISRPWTTDLFCPPLWSRTASALTPTRVNRGCPRTCSFWKSRHCGECPLLG
jgi:hypothetical protein